MNQPDIFRKKKNLEILPVKFQIQFFCDDSCCNGHDISILDWGLSELYRKIRTQQNWKDKIRHKVLKEICGGNRDIHLLMGNMVSRRQTFCIIGFFSPPKQSQLTLSF
jgi:hypothetical protein